MEISHLKE
uniref:Uncharacterized protein n=1 Tax=Nymphaea colorata TaxID=210225 RepID=A0A5K0XTF0_9MAGN